MKRKREFEIDRAKRRAATAEEELKRNSSTEAKKLTILGYIKFSKWSKDPTASIEIFCWTCDSNLSKAVTAADMMDYCHSLLEEKRSSLKKLLSS